jgi:ABC-type glycerol-3-phosphate transport system substrate-binding protein
MKIPPLVGFAVLILSFTLLTSIAAQDEKGPTGTILVWMQPSNQAQIEQQLLAAFEEEYPDVTVDFAVFGPAEMADKFLEATATGNGVPDVALMENTEVPRIVASRELVDLTTRLEDTVDDFLPAALEVGVQDGRYYTVPYDLGPVVLYYRRDIFDAAGLPDDPRAVAERVATWDDFLAVCETILEETGLPCFTSSQAANTGDLWTSMLWSQGVGWFEDDEVTLASPEAVAALETLGEFWEAGVTADIPEWSEEWFASLNTRLPSSQAETTPAVSDPEATAEVTPEVTPTVEPAVIVDPVATLPGASWMSGQLRTWVAPNTAGRWGVVPFPAFEGGERSANQGGSSFVIPRQSDNADTAWAFVEFVTSNNSLRTLFASGDIFPARTSTYTTEVVTLPDDYFAGQPIREVFVDAALSLPSVNIYGVNYPLMNGATDAAIRSYATGDVSADNALSRAADFIRAETDLE